MVIPKHSTMRIYTADGKKDLLPDANMLIEQELTIPITSNFGSLYPTPQNTIMDIANVVSILGTEISQEFANADEGLGKMIRGFGNLAKGISGRYKEFGFQIYKGNDPLRLNLSLGLYATWDAKVQVHDPVMKFMMNPLPVTTNDNSIQGLVNLQLEPYPASTTAKTFLSSLETPGPSISIIKPRKEGEENTGRNRVFSIEIGDFFFKDVFITGATPTFSKEKMKVGNNFYSMNCKLQLDISTVFILTRKDIYNLSNRRVGG